MIDICRGRNIFFSFFSLFWKNETNIIYQKKEININVQVRLISVRAGLTVSRTEPFPSLEHSRLICIFFCRQINLFLYYCRIIIQPIQLDPWNSDETDHGNILTLKVNWLYYLCTVQTKPPDELVKFQRNPGRGSSLYKPHSQRSQDDTLHNR